MYGIRVIARKVGKNSFMAQRFTNYINILTSNAKEAEGFIKSKSYRCIEEYGDANKDVVISISDWKSKEDWTNWLKSVNRKSIRDAHKESISSETFTMLLKSNEDNTFLL